MRSRSIAAALWVAGLLMALHARPPACGQADEGAPFRQARERMVREQIVHRGVTDAAVLQAMGAVPRHRFVPAAMQPHAYEDRPLPIGHRQTINGIWYRGGGWSAGKRQPLSKYTGIVLRRTDGRREGNPWN